MRPVGSNSQRVLTTKNQSATLLKDPLYLVGYILRLEIFEQKHHILPVTCFTPPNGILTVIVHPDRSLGPSVRVPGAAGVLAGVLPGQVELQPVRLMLPDLCNERRLISVCQDSGLL